MQSNAIAETNLDEARALSAHLKANEGYIDCRVLEDGTVAGLYDLLFTRAIMLGCTSNGWGSRYCFQDRDLATQRFLELKTEDDVPAGHIASRAFIPPRDT